MTRLLPSALLAGLGAAALAVPVLVVPGVAAAQSTAQLFTSATRYDAMGRVTGTISADPDLTLTASGQTANGPLPHLATRTTYNDAGWPVLVESGELSSWKDESVAPENWGNDFTVNQSVATTYDAMGRKTVETVIGSDGVAVSLTQYSYDSVGRLECTAVRMHTDKWSSLPATACIRQWSGGVSLDRVSKNIYDAAGQLLQVRVGVGSDIEAADITYTYTANGKIKLVIDANGNKAKYDYDGFDRLVSWYFPGKSGPPTGFDDTDYDTVLATAGNWNGQDHEDYTYDANGNRLTLRKRDGSVITYTYDALGRMTVKDLPVRAGLAANLRRDVYYDYDLRGLQTEARFDSAAGTEGVFSTYDGFGRLVATADTLGGASLDIASEYDANGNRTAVVHDDGTRFEYQYDGLDRFDLLREGFGGGYQLVNPKYDAAGRLSGFWHQNDAVDRQFGYDTVGRLSDLDFTGVAGSAQVQWGFTRNPAGQIATETRDNASYAWTDHVNVDRDYLTNGLNQYTDAGPADFCYDANGNLTADGGFVYLYDIENRLVQMRAQVNANCSALDYTGTWKAGLAYDPLGRLNRINFGTVEDVRLLHDGDALIGEYDQATGALLRRYVHGPDMGADDPLLWYEGATTGFTDRRNLYADARGSIALVADASGSTIAINTYDEYGIPGATNAGRFQYTGQLWLERLQMYYYKARIYSPTLGRFLQTDPIGYEDQFNLYAYVGNDPVNRFDPTGEDWEDVGKVFVGTVKIAAGTVGAVVGGTLAGGGTVVTVGSGGTMSPVSVPTAVAGVAIVAVSGVVATDGVNDIREGVEGLRSENDGPRGGTVSEAKRNKQDRNAGKKGKKTKTQRGGGRVRTTEGGTKADQKADGARRRGNQDRKLKPKKKDKE